MSTSGFYGWDLGKKKVTGHTQQRYSRIARRAGRCTRMLAAPRPPRGPIQTRGYGSQTSLSMACSFIIIRGTVIDARRTRRRPRRHQLARIVAPRVLHVLVPFLGKQHKPLLPGDLVVVLVGIPRPEQRAGGEQLGSRQAVTEANVPRPGRSRGAIDRHRTPGDHGGGLVGSCRTVPRARRTGRVHSNLLGREGVIRLKSPGEPALSRRVLYCTRR